MRWPGALTILLLAAPGCDVSAHDVPTSCRPPPAAAVGARGVVVVDTDYTSTTNIRLVGWDGSTYSSSIVSSALGSVGLSVTLSGDVVVPSQAPTSGQIVILDRTSGVITWADPSTCAVRTQMPIADCSDPTSPNCFDADPYDYLETALDHAYVLRYDNNFNAGPDALDRGGDVLVINPATGARLASIPLQGDVGSGQLPSPAQLLPWSGGATPIALVVLENLAHSKEQADDGVIVAIDEATDTEAFHVTMPGAQNCGAMIALSRGRVVVSCTGAFLSNNDADVSDSALVVLSPDGSGKLVETSRTLATSVGTSSFAPYLGSPGGDLVLVGTYGNDVDMTHTTTVPDTWLLVDVVKQALVQTVAVGTADGMKGPAFVLGGVACDASASPPVCIGADAAGQGALRRFNLAPGAASLSEVLPPLAGGDPYGLQPRYLGLW